MRTLAAVTAAVMIASTATASEHSYFSDSAAYACAGAAKSAGAYRSALASKNTGVVESALAQVAMFRLNMPECEMGQAKANVRAVESRGATPELRYKAWVVRTLMENPGLFAAVPKSGYAEPDALFAALAGTLAEHYAAR